MAFAVRTESWSEDVALHDGRQITVEREVDWTFRIASGDAAAGFNFLKNWPDKFWFKFKHPDTQETIKWQGEQHYIPVLLDLINGVPYLVVYGRPTKRTESIYGCAELPYTYLRYNSKNGGRWEAIPLDKALRDLRRANLSPDYPGIGKKHLSTDDVQSVMLRRENSSSYHFQQEIPRDYNEWRNPYKNSYLNERDKDDCRPPRSQLTPVSLPTATERTQELIKTIDYAPERVSVGDDWERLTFDKKREGECKKLFRPTNQNDYMQDQRFVGDPTGGKRVPYSSNGQFQMGVRMLCDEYVWFVTHQEVSGKMVITKYTHAGDIAFRISFLRPEPVPGFVGYIAIPSLRSEAGFLYFDWMDFRDINREWHIKRILKLRVREPAEQNAGINK